MLETEILAAVEDCLVTRGCIAFTVDDVAARVGVAKGTVYQHFASRGALIERALREVAGRSAARFADLLSAFDVPTAIGGYAKSTVRHVNGVAAATGRRELTYPCCLVELRCPYHELDSLTPTIAAALHQARANAELAGTWWEAATLARWIRVLLSDALVRAHTGDPAAIESEIDMAVQLLERAILPRPEMQLPEA